MGPGNHLPSSQGWSFFGASIPKRRISWLPNFTVSPSATEKPCEVLVPLSICVRLSERWRMAAAQRTNSARPDFHFVMLAQIFSRIFAQEGRFGY